MEAFWEGPQICAAHEVEVLEAVQLSKPFGEWDEGQRFKGSSGCMVDLEICMHNMQARLCGGLLGETVASRSIGG